MAVKVEDTIFREQNLTGLRAAPNWSNKAIITFQLGRIGGNETALQTFGEINVRSNTVRSTNSDFDCLSTLLLFVHFDTQ